MRTYRPDRRDRKDAARLWSRDYLLAIIVNFFVATVFYLLVTSMALYAVDRFGASETGAGLAAGSFVLGAVLARLLGGKYLDFVGRRRMLLVSLAVCVVAALLYLPADSLGLVVVVRTIHGIAFGAGSTAVTSGALALIPAARRAEGAGYYGISTTLGSAAGPIAAVLLVSEVGYPALFLASAACALAGFVVGLFLRLPERDPSPEEVRTKWQLHPSTLVDRASLPISSLMLVAGIAFTGVLTFLNSYAESEGSFGSGALFFGLYAVTVLCSRLFVGRVQDSLGDNWVIYPLLGCLAAGMALLAIAPTGVPLIGAAVLIGLGFGALMPSVQAIAVSVSEPHRVGLVTSTFFLMTDLGVGIGPLIDGALIPLVGYRGLYLVLAGAAVACAFVYHLGHGRASRLSRSAVGT